MTETGLRDWIVLRISHAGYRMGFPAGSDERLSVAPIPAAYVHRAGHHYDALIVAAALDAGCTRLFSKDLQHGSESKS